jgi:hypothetical protein
MMKSLLRLLGVGKKKTPPPLTWSSPPSPFTKIALHCGEGRSEAFHLDLWIPLLRSAGTEFCLIIRNQALYRHVSKKYAKVPVALAQSSRAVQELLEMFPALATILYTSNTGNNIHLLRFNHLRHVFIGHGDSEKGASAHKFFRAYDELWVAGQAHIDRFAHAPFDSGHLRFVKIGRPLLQETMVFCAAHPWRERFFRPRLLYAPTWEGYIAKEDYSSLHIAADLLMAAANTENVEVYAKLHPLTGKVNPELKNFAGSLKLALRDKTRLWIYDPFRSFHTVLAETNIFVCDISSVITECLAAYAPIFVYKPHALGNTAFSGMPLEHFTYCFSDVETFKEKLSSVIQGEDSLAPAREEAMEYYLGRSSMESEHFIKLLSEI